MHKPIIQYDAYGNSAEVIRVSFDTSFFAAINRIISSYTHGHCASRATCLQALGLIGSPLIPADCTKQANTSLGCSCML